jgi:hypothetical protein
MPFPTPTPAHKSDTGGRLRLARSEDAEPAGARKLSVVPGCVGNARLGAGRCRRRHVGVLVVHLRVKDYLGSCFQCPRSLATSTS